MAGEHRNGRLVADSPTATARKRRRIGMVFQRFNLFAHLSALDNVAIGPRRVLGMKPADARALAAEQLGARPYVRAHVETANPAFRRSAAARGDRARHGHAAGPHAVR